MLSTLAHEEVFPIRVLLVARDLNARARLEAAGHTVMGVAPDALATTLAGGTPEAVVVDLDEAGVAAVELAMQANAQRVVAFFSHVDADLGEEARRAGAEVYPRGRFWRDLADILS